MAANEKQEMDADIEAALEFFEPANQQALRYMASSLGLPAAPDCGHRTRPTPTLDQLDRR